MASVLCSIVLGNAPGTVKSALPFMLFLPLITGVARQRLCQPPRAKAPPWLQPACHDNVRCQCGSQQLPPAAVAPQSAPAAHRRLPGHPSMHLQHVCPCHTRKTALSTPPPAPTGVPGRYWGGDPQDVPSPATRTWMQQQIGGLTFVDASTMPYPRWHRPLAGPRGGEFHGCGASMHPAPLTAPCAPACTLRL